MNESRVQSTTCQAKRSSGCSVARVRLLVGAVALSALLLSGCGGKSEEKISDSPAAAVQTTTPAPPSAEDDLTVAVAAYSKAYLTGDGANAYALLSKKCQANMPLSEFAGLTEQAKTLYGNVKIKSVKVVVDGDQVTATYTYPVPAINQTDEPWVLEDGTWHNGEC